MLFIWVVDVIHMYLRGVAEGCEYILRQNHKDIFLRYRTPWARDCECHSKKRAILLEQGQKIKTFSTEEISKWYGNNKKYAACNSKFIRFTKVDRNKATACVFRSVIKTFQGMDSKI